MLHRQIHKAIKHAFIPHKENDYRPHFLREHVVLTIVIASILLLLLSVTSYLVIRKTAFGTLVASSVLIDLTNDTRKDLGLGPLLRNNLLQKSSLDKGLEMATLGYFAHASPDGSAPWKFFKNAQYSFAYAGENLALNFPSSKQVHTGWLNSPKHRDNIIDPKFREIGISVISSTEQGKRTLFVVQHFGLPKDATPKTDTALRYSSFLERAIFKSSSYIETLYFSLIGIILIAITLMVVIEVEKRHKKHIVYGILMLIIVILCTLINAELLS